MMNWFDGWTLNIISLGTLFAALSGIAPPIAALLSAVWFAVQIYESRTFQHWKRNRQMKSRAKKLAKLRAREKVTLAEIEAIERLRHARSEALEIVAAARAEADALIAHEAADMAAANTPPKPK